MNFMKQPEPCMTRVENIVSPENVSRPDMSNVAVSIENNIPVAPEPVMQDSTETTKVRTPINSSACGLENEIDFTKDLYKTFKRGRIPATKIEKCPEYIDMQKQFINRTRGISLTFCSVCNERWFDTVINKNKCKNCNDFSYLNDCDPFPVLNSYPFHLPN